MADVLYGISVGDGAGGGCMFETGRSQRVAISVAKALRPALKDGWTVSPVRFDFTKTPTAIDPIEEPTNG